MRPAATPAPCCGSVFGHQAEHAAARMSLPDRRSVIASRHLNNMPESSPELPPDRQQRDGTARTSNIVSVVSQLADDNLTLVRNVSTGLAVAGVIIIARSIRLITKFRSASEIPARFIERNVSLRGKVHSVTEKDLRVEHVPIHLPVLSTLLTRHANGSASPLLVHLAGVELTPEGRTWLQKKLAPSQPVWLKLVSREEETLHCLVYETRGTLWNCCMNEELLRQGLARGAPLPGVLPGSRLHKRLHRAEAKAERKGRGLWKEEGYWERTSKAVRANAVSRWIRRVFKRT